jgi:2,4-diaminopentanoate dehydrogenase
VTGTNDIKALLALKPDCVVYNPMWIDVDEMARILESGANIVTTAGFVTGHSLGDGRSRIIEACERGGTSVFGSGINPGFVDLLAIVAAGGCDRVDITRSPRKPTSAATTRPIPSFPSGSRGRSTTLSCLP